MSRLAAHGLSLVVPHGWEAELTVQPDPSALDPELPPARTEPVVLHAANFALPADRGDYGSRAVEIMGQNGVFFAVIEFDESCASRRLFVGQGVPRRLSAEEFAPDQLQMPISGQAGLQRFFRVASRAFCLYVVIGSHALRGLLVREVNRVLAGLKIERSPVAQDGVTRR